MGEITHCEKCHRVRRHLGLHICLEVAMSRRLEKPPAIIERSAAVVESPRRISSFVLPGQGPAAQVWNAMVERRRRGA